MSALLDDLHRAAFTITPLIVKPEYEHMKQAWEMVLGGLIAPAMAAEDPASVEGTLKALLDRYTPDKVKAFFTPRKEVVERRMHEVIIKKVPTPGELHRRIKGEIKKTKKMEDLLTCPARDVIIRWWNENQHLIAEDDPACIRMASEINSIKTADAPLIAPAQVSGYISHLCRMGYRTSSERELVFKRSIKRGKHTVVPVYSDEFILRIIDHREVEKVAAAKRKVEHARIRTERGLPPLEEVKVDTVSTGLVPDASRVPETVGVEIPAPAAALVDKPKRKRTKKAKEPAIISIEPPVAEVTAVLEPEKVSVPKSATPVLAPVVDDPLEGLC